MTEALFIFTLIFVAYVVYSVLGTSVGAGGTAPVSASKPAAVREAMPEKTAELSSPVVPQDTSLAAAQATNSSAAPVQRAVTNLRDPKTGEVAAIPANYRFAKRWIKDALVAEGLLDKVYKNSDLNDGNAALIKDAMEKLKAIEKYQA